MNFVKYFFMAGGAHFVLAFIVFFAIHLVAPSFTLEAVVAASFGGALGTGLVCGVIAQIKLAG